MAELNLVIAMSDGFIIKEKRGQDGILPGGRVKQQTILIYMKYIETPCKALPTRLSQLKPV